MAALYTQGLPCPSPPTRALPPQVNRSRAGNGPWWWRRAPLPGAPILGGASEADAPPKPPTAAWAAADRAPSRSAHQRRVREPSGGYKDPPQAQFAPPPPPPAPAPPGSRGRGKGQSPPLGRHCAEAMAPTSRCAVPPPPQASPPRRSDGTAGKPCGLMRAQSGYNPPTGGGVAPLVSGSRSRRPALPIYTRKEAKHAAEH